MKQNQKQKQVNIQIVSIFAIIFLSYLGTAFLFFHLHTSALKNSIEAETNMFATVLKSEISKEYTIDEIYSNEKFTKTIQKIIDDGENGNQDSDVWIISKNGEILCRDSKINDEEEVKIIFENKEKDGITKGWTGNKELLFLRKNYYVIEPIFEERAYLVVLNYCAEAHALQRQQVALFGSSIIVFFLIAVILIANLISNYRSQLIRLATTDELTGLMNRKSFTEEFNQFVENDHKPSTLFLLDIDFFKQINDSKGHSAGDYALHFLASKIKNMVKENGGFAGRWGGDEFIGVLTHTGTESKKLLDKLCEEIEKSELPENLKMTISAGSAEFTKEKNLAEISEKADAALYNSKENGRNQATLYDKSMLTKAVQAGVATGIKEQEIEEKTNLYSVKDLIEKEQKENQPEEKQGRKKLLKHIQEELIPSILLGVQWMAPFVAGGGILIALAFLFDAASVDIASLSIEARANFGSITPIAATLKDIGGVTFNFMLPVFAGFMATGLAGDAAFMAGFVGGYMTIQSNAGFVGAMIAGLMAGIMAREIQQFTGRFPQFIRKAAPIVIYPVFNLIIMQAITMLLITPVANALGQIFLKLLSEAELINESLAGGLAGLMMAIDMGGIINKVAYNYAVNGLMDNRLKIMASVMAGGMIPPIGIFLSIICSPHKYTAYEQERGPSAFFMGLSFITEGALPYVFTDPLRVIPCCMVGSGIAGFLSMMFGCELPAPHGGVFVFLLISRAGLYILSLIVGSAVTAVLLGAVKTTRTDENIQKQGT